MRVCVKLLVLMVGSLAFSWVRADIVECPVNMPKMDLILQTYAKPSTWQERERRRITNTGIQRKSHRVAGGKLICAYKTNYSLTQLQSVVYEISQPIPQGRTCVLKPQFRFFCFTTGAQPLQQPPQSHRYKAPTRLP